MEAKRTYKRKCYICHRRRTPGSNLFLAAFPLNPIRRRLWLNAIGIEDQGPALAPIGRLIGTKYLCEHHFRPECLIKVFWSKMVFTHKYFVPFTNHLRNRTRTRLLLNVVPTRNLTPVMVADQAIPLPIGQHPNPHNTETAANNQEVTPVASTSAMSPSTTQQPIQSMGPSKETAVYNQEVTPVASTSAMSPSTTQQPIQSMGPSKDVTVNQGKTDNKLMVKQNNGIYHELVQLEQNDIVVNKETFECEICLCECAPSAGCVLRECFHAFCHACLEEGIRQCAEGEAVCPAGGCSAALQQREVRGLVSPPDFERWLARGLKVAESGARHAFHCRTRDCAGWALVEPPVQSFPCPVCKAVNCVPCQAIHPGVSCEQYKIRLSAAANMQGAPGTMDDNTKSYITNLITSGKGMACPECKAIITKKMGCDWVECAACKTEICWATRGRRWGPGGHGDTSGGCRCRVGSKRCHPSCGNCH